MTNSYHLIRNGMKVEIEDITKEVKSRLFKPKPHKKNIEIPVTTLWDHSPKVFTEEDGIPPDKWDFRPKK